MNLMRGILISLTVTSSSPQGSFYSHEVERVDDRWWSCTCEQTRLLFEIIEWHLPFYHRRPLLFRHSYWWNHYTTIFFLLQVLKTMVAHLAKFHSSRSLILRLVSHCTIVHKGGWPIIEILSRCRFLIDSINYWQFQNRVWRIEKDGGDSLFLRIQ
jgi:hypothetical protein